jgi:hypothetical protein
MSLLREIQNAVLDDHAALEPALLKLRYLANRLGDVALEDWVSHEISGYPDGSPVPDYRIAPLSYNGTFSDGVTYLNDVSIPLYLIKEHAGEGWLNYHVREPLASLEPIIAKLNSPSKDNGNYGLPCADLKLILQNKIYERIPLVEIRSEFNPIVFIKTKSTVRSKLLDLTLELENMIPEAAEIEVSSLHETPEIDAEAASKISQQIINYGTVTNINSSGDNSQITTHVTIGDIDGLVAALAQGGIPIDQANELKAIAASEPAGEENKFHEKAMAWLGAKLVAGADKAWNVTQAAGIAWFKVKLNEYLGIGS